MGIIGGYIECTQCTRVLYSTSNQDSELVVEELVSNWPDPQEGSA